MKRDMRTLCYIQVSTGNGTVQIFACALCDELEN